MSIALQLAGPAFLVLAIALAIPALVLFVEIVAALFARPHGEQQSTAPARPRFAVLMPAHDEAAGIAASIATILPQLHSGDRLLVVADNCGDATAAVARAAGAEVVERHDLSRRGKGYALDFGVRALEGDCPPVVIIVDADCSLGAQALHRLATRCAEVGRPVQALYLMHAPPGAGLRLRIAAFAWVLKNQARPLGLLRLRLPCQLMGTGMAFPWEPLRSAALASGHLVEDMQLGIDLALAGFAPLFCPQACVTSLFPSQADGAAAQRTRWEHGHLSMIASAGPQLVWRALVQRRMSLLTLALDLCVPPLASLVLLIVGLAVLAWVLLLAGGSALPLWIALGALGAVALGVLLAWRAHGRQIVSLGDLLAVPAYVLAKVPMYARLLRKRQVDWVRTKRDRGPE
ncbi:MAG: glycosyltransferase family 2 protein [Caldimonas sp.]